MDGTSFGHPTFNSVKWPKDLGLEQTIVLPFPGYNSGQLSQVKIANVATATEKDHFRLKQSASLTTESHSVTVCVHGAQ